MLILKNRQLVRNFSNNIEKIKLDKVSSQEFYKSLRIYKHLSFSQLLSAKFVWEACRYDIQVDNGEKLYNTSYKYLGRNITNFILGITMGKQFTAGDSTETLRSTCLKVNSLGFGVMIDYLAELKPGEDVPESEFEWNCTMNETAIRECHVHEKNSFAIKISGLCNLYTLLKVNKVQEKLDEIFVNENNEKVFFITKNMLCENLRKIGGIEFEDQEFEEFFAKIKVESADKIVRSTNPNRLSLAEWRANVGCVNMVKPEMNQDSIFRKLSNYTEEEIEHINSMQRRAISNITCAAENQLFIAIDAEQTYIQSVINMVTEQLQMSLRLDKKEGKILNTYQAYLKKTGFMIDVELHKKEILGQPVSMKQVRGAYLVEESKLALENGYENPIHNSIEETHDNYNSCAIKILDKISLDDKFLIASHNQHTIFTMMDYLKKSEKIDNELKKCISFAQIYGLGDNLSHMIINENFDVVKYVPFGEKDIMFPYLLRRAQEAKDMIKGVNLQSKLINDEFKKRIGLS